MKVVEYNLGRTGLKITPIGQGCWQFAGAKGLVGGFWRALSQDEVNQIVGAAIDEGITWFDTAEAYGMGASERSLSAGLAAKGIRFGTVIVPTKWFPILRTARSITSTFPVLEQALEE